ncbi:MAG: hypothetical protein GY756_27820 [bacterium]|nr:hypothetical protein [bacterium]
MSQTLIQSVRFNRNNFSLTQASKMMMKSGLKAIKPVDVTLNQYRYRLFDPKIFIKTSFRTIADKKHIGLSYVVGKPKINVKTKFRVKRKRLAKSIPKRTRERIEREKMIREKELTKEVIIGDEKLNIEREIKKMKQYTQPPRKKRTKRVRTYERPTIFRW